MKALRELIAAVGLLGAVFSVALNYAELPRRVPLHFNAAGLPDGWGDKSALWLLAGIACFLYAVLSLIRFLPERWFNLPVAQPYRAQAIPLVLEMVGWLKAETLCLFAYINWTAVGVVQGRVLGLGAWFLPVTLAVLFGSIAFYLARVVRLSCR